MYKKILHIVQFCVFVSLLTMILSCASKKKKTDAPSVMTKFVQNTTAYYNGYFNADEILTFTYKALESTHKDNYNKLLPLYPTMTDDVKAQKAELERANEKLIKVANGHEISHWRDDCYVMIGEIQFLLKDYESAEETFEYFTQEFDPLTLKNRKLNSNKKKTNRDRKKKLKERKKESAKKHKASSTKKSKKRSSKKRKKKSKKKSRGKKKRRPDKPATTKSSTEKKNRDTKGAPIQRVQENEKTPKPAKSGVFKHTPAYNEGTLWMARTYIERGKPSLAQSLINRIEERPDLDAKILPKIKVAQAHLYIVAERYEKAIVALSEAIPLTKSRKLLARYWYVLAQMQEILGDYSSAANSYGQVIRYKPVYDMWLNAELSQIKCRFKEDGGGLKKAVSKLKKMLKDEKNETFLGEIYYVLASVSLASDKVDDALEYFNLSIKEGQSRNQKMEAFLALADLFYERENYVDAKLYYDSSLAIMNKIEERYSIIKKKADNLSQIATNISIITLQDSLLRVSRMTRREKLALAKSIAAREKEKKEQEEEKKLAAANNNVAAKNPFQLGGFNPLPNRQQSNFFAYNPIAVAKGKKEFKRKWGNRVLEDNWRRQQKGTISVIADEEDETEETADDLEDKDLIRKYLSGIPKSKSQKQAANDKIEKALFELGKLYRDKLSSNQKSVETLEKLLKRYPGTQYKPTAYYYLHLAYRDLDDEAKAKYYADKLIRDIPESLFAKILKDPDFLKTWLAEQNKLGKYYDETYALFKAGEYARVRQRVSAVKKLFGPDNKYQPKFAMLDAMAMGSAGGKDAYIEGMKDMVAKYPNTPESTRAKEILRFLNGEKDAFKVAGEAGEEVFPQFAVEDDKRHYIIVVISDLKSASLSEIKINISQYNRKYHSKSKLKMSSIDLDLDNSTPVIMMRRFRDKKDAMNYYKGVMRKQDKFILKDIDYDIFAISQRNYREVIKEKSAENYQRFFEQTYLKN